MTVDFIPSEDFWSRRANAQKFSFEFAPLGTTTMITANDPAGLAAVSLSAKRFAVRSDDFSRQSATEVATTNKIQIVVGRQVTAPVPEDLPERLVYSGVGDWLTVSAGEWGHAFANLQSLISNLFLSPALAAETRIVSRYFVDHYLLNFLLREWAMLHASCVTDADRKTLIIMVAPHNTGKSTTALHLLRAGYHFLADGMALLKLREERLVVGGYPVGEVKLRDDVLAAFPDYAGEAVKVREHRKTVVDLRLAHPTGVIESLVMPDKLHLCFVERGERAESKVAPLEPTTARELLRANTVYWDYAPRLAHNTAALTHLLGIAGLHRLQIGSDPDRIASIMESLK
jgi:hypothetical protein